ncbi:hypothetical protein [Comamonas testosteroni]|uniref:hypothetical protein n=1 Tax=Comamonas testosteroni TaxID=285 RepID=UPI0026EC6175|nr:hypothetical protein [Comamonas testosteroni]WQD44928.1 hypothetical protein U0024_09240 [Comamonas testosteroni]
MSDCKALLTRAKPLAEDFRQALNKPTTLTIVEYALHQDRPAQTPNPLRLGSAHIITSRSKHT